MQVSRMQIFKEKAKKTPFWKWRIRVISIWLLCVGRRLNAPLALLKKQCAERDTTADQKQERHLAVHVSSQHQ